MNWYKISRLIPNTTIDKSININKLFKLLYEAHYKYFKIKNNEKYPNHTQKLYYYLHEVSLELGKRLKNIFEKWIDFYVNKNHEEIVKDKVNKVFSSNNKIDTLSNEIMKITGEDGSKALTIIKEHLGKNYYNNINNNRNEVEQLFTNIITPTNISSDIKNKVVNLYNEIIFNIENQDIENRSTNLNIIKNLIHTEDLEILTSLNKISEEKIDINYLDKLSEIDTSQWEKEIQNHIRKEQ